MDTKNVNLRDVQLLHDGIIQAMDALRRIAPAMTEVAAVQAFGTPMPFDPFGVTRASFEHAAFNSRLGWGGNPVLGTLPFGYNVSPFGFGDVYNRGLSHSPFSAVNNPMLGNISNFGTISGFPTTMTGLSSINTLGYTNPMNTFGTIPFVPFRTF